MKALKKLLVVVMVMSLVVHPAFVDVVLAIDYDGTEGGVEIMPEGADLYKKVQDVVIVPPEPEPVLAEEMTKAIQEPYEYELPADQQEDYRVIFDTTPVNVKVTPADPDQPGSSTRYDYYDKDGKLIGSMYNDNSNANAQTFVDKDGKKIDIAAKLAEDTVTAEQAASVFRVLSEEAKIKVLSSDKISAEKAAAILASDKIDAKSAAQLLYAIKGTNEKKVTDILAKLDTASPTKAADIRGKIGVGSNDITKMLPDVAAEYLSKLDPAKAATELAKLDAYSAAAVIASSKMSSEAAAKIFGAMDADKVAEILSTSSGWWRDYYIAADTNREIAMCPPLQPTISPAKAAEILGKMTTDQAAKILGSDKMNASFAGDILENTEAKTAGEILNKMDTGKAAGVLATVTTEKAVNILAGMDATKAAGIIASDKIDSTTAANILYALKSKDEAQLNKVLTALDTANKTKADDIRAKIGVGSNDITKMIPDAAADYLSGLDPEKAAVELAKLTPTAALAVIASNKMSAETAAKIFGKMAADKVAEILSAMMELVVFDGAKIGVSSEIWPRFGVYLDPAKAAQILGKMTKDQAAAILASSKMNNWTAGSILANMETATAVELLNKMDTGKAAEIISSMNFDVGAKIISAMTTDQAVKILSSDKMNPKWSGYILTQVKTETAVAILTAMDKGVAATIFGGMDTKAAATIAAAMDPAKAAAIFANDKISADDASRILYEMDTAKATGILQQLDLVNSAKSADLRAKLGIGSNDISKMLPEVAAEFLSKMDPAKAAAELIKLDREVAGAILASLKLSAEQTAKIFEAMDADKAAEIMSSNNYKTTNYDKAAEVFDKMNTDAAVKILTSAKMDKHAASFMLSNMSTETAVKIVSKMNADTAATLMNFMSTYAAGKVLSGLDADFAASILNNVNLSASTAGYMLNWTDKAAAANIITKLAALDTPRAAAILYYTASSNAMICAEIVNGLSTDVAAKIFANANMHADTAALVLSMDKITVEKASEILSKIKATDAQKVSDILTKLDGINLAKSDQIREKIGLAVDISTMTPEAAAEYLSKLDPAVAAAKLAKLAADKAADIMFSSKMTLDAAAKIFNNLTADQAAEILTAQYAGGVNGGSNALPRSIGGINADELLAAMDPAKAGAILGSSKLEAGMAAKIVVTMSTDTAKSILSTMDPKKAADILSTQKIVDGGNALNPLISSAQAAEILASMGTDKATAIMNNMNAGYAALIVNALTEDAALKILGAMDAAKVAGILLAQNDNGPVSPANHKTWDVISADKAASLLGKLDPSKAAQILGALPADGAKAASIIASTKFDNKAAADVLAAMDPAKAAAILTYCKIERGVNSRTVYPPAISREKSAAILQAMSREKAAAIIGGFTTLDIDSAIVGGEILSEMPADTAARLINRIPAAGGKTKNEVQAALLSKMSHVIVANILNSRFMTVHKAAKILNTLGKSDSARVALFINELAKINKNKAGNILRHLDIVEKRVA